ncbi:MAG: response regulator [Spirochaetaceae bacterium]|jgi:putative two-component system response regulator|nr:response regulator [Spirochaetaceae bacterium]
MEGKKIILAVDDMASNLRTIKVVLEKQFDVRLAKSGETALSVLKNEPVALILLDIEMPGMSGFEFLEKLKNNPDAKDIPVIFVTSHGDSDVVREASKRGIKDYILKPITPEKLEKRVHAALNYTL